MAKFSKWIGGGLGWVVGGPIGGLLGFVIGSVIDNTTVIRGSQAGYVNPTTPGAFGVSLIVLIAAVMKADGKVVKDELDYVKRFFITQFGHASAQEALVMLRDLLKQEIPVKDVCDQIARNMDYASRLQLLHILLNISASDKAFHPSEVKLIETISGYLRIKEADFLSIKNMFLPATDWAYKVLEIDESAGGEEIKKAYRKMAVKYHPDKVSHLGEEYQKNAEEKFKKVNEAYEALKKEKGIV